VRWKFVRRWTVAVLPLILGVLVAASFESGWLPDFVFAGRYHFDLAAISFSLGLLVSLGLAAVLTVHLNRKAKMERLLDQERAAQAVEQQRFLRRLDHELKNPLTTIRLGIANLQENTYSEKDASTLERIAHQAQRLQVLVEDLRRLAELDEASLEREPVELTEILEESVEMTRSAPEWHMRSVQLVTQQVPWPLSSVCGDRDMLVLAFRNLIENSLKFSAPEGRVEVRAAEDGHAALVEVADTGRGIPAEDLPHILDELYRGQNARDLPGSGLGLALVQRIIKLHGGSLEVHSRLDQGTIVRVHLPLSVH